MRKGILGFTLLELMITVAIIAILAAIALPSYGNYIKKSRANNAASDLVTLSLMMENAYQKTLAYPATTITTGTTQTQTYISTNTGINWIPAESNNFDYKVTAPSTVSGGTTATTYTLTAIGKTGTQNAGCTLSLTQANVRTISGGAACGGMTSW